MTTNRCPDPSCTACSSKPIRISIGVYPKPLFSLPALIAIILGIAFAVGLATSGCAEDLAGSCTPIADGTYRSSAGDVITFESGVPSGSWACTPDQACATAMTCSPIGETVQTYSFRSAGDNVEERVSPPDVTVVLAPSP